LVLANGSDVSVSFDEGFGGVVGGFDPAVADHGVEGIGDFGEGLADELVGLSQLLQGLHEGGIAGVF